jgi:S1-C subfamily serine protease
LITTAPPTYGRTTSTFSVTSGDSSSFSSFSSSYTSVLHGHDGVSIAKGQRSSSSHLITDILPQALEQTIKIKKAEEPLGINVELIDDGINGVMVTSVAVGGPFHRDSRIQAGDYLITVNNESLRNVTNAQARAILRRAQLFSKDLR